MINPLGGSPGSSFASPFASPFASATSGLARAARRFEDASARIAQPEPADPIGDRVEQIAAEHAFAANLATARTADALIGSLIDIVA